MTSGYKVLLLLLSTLFLWACGGGGDIQDENPDNSGSDDYAITLSLNDTGGSKIAQVSQANPGVLIARVTRNNEPVVNQRVDFSLNGRGALGADSALTDSSGEARIDVLPGSESGAGTITSSISVPNSDAVTSSIDFSTAGDGSSGESNINIAVRLTDSEGNAVNTINSVTPGLVTATVTGIDRPVIVRFATDRGSFPIDAVVTDNGVAAAQILAGTQPGAGTITVSLSSGEFSESIFTVGATNLFMGGGDPFIEGVAQVSAEDLSAGGTASISVRIQDNQGRPYTEPVTVIFSSTCSAKNPATAELSSPVESFNGVATSTYLAQGCVGNDTINVSADTGGTTLSATGTINVLPADVGSISFDSAVPNFITLRGTGGEESSVIKFKVFDKNSDPVSNQQVNFALNTYVGDLELNPVIAVTNLEGIVQTVVNSGSVPTPVRVTATVDGSEPLISSQSNTLYVSTGLPDQDSFTLSASTLNPEGWNRNDSTVTITAQLADTFNNPVPDNTVVSFTTEGGRIEDECRTVNGSCSVEWVSQNPKPSGATLDQLGALPSASRSLGQPYGGRVTVTAYALGEESFPDLNGNNRFDPQELNQFRSQTDVAGNPYDLTEAFVDYNEDRLFNPEIGRYPPLVRAGAQEGGNAERPIDFDNDGEFDIGNGLYDGSLCALTNNVPHQGCSESKSINVRSSLVLVMSGSHPRTTDADIEDACPDDPAETDPARDRCEGANGNDAIDILGKGVGGASFIISDLHNQPLPAGTTINFSTSVGNIASTNPIIIPSSNRNSARSVTVRVQGTDEVESGLLTVEVTTPNEITTILHEITVNIR